MFVYVSDMGSVHKITILQFGVSFMNKKASRLERMNKTDIKAIRLCFYIAWDLRLIHARHTDDTDVNACVVYALNYKVDTFRIQNLQRTDVYISVHHSSVVATRALEMSVCPSSIHLKVDARAPY
jgi:hypothetical protein